MAPWTSGRASTSPSGRSLWSQAALGAAVVAAASVAGLASIVIAAMSAAAVLGIAFLVGLAFIAAADVRIAFALSIIALVIVPLGAAPTFLGIRLAPGLLGLWLVALVLTVRNLMVRSWQPTMIDWSFLVVVLGLLLSALGGVHTVAELAAILWLWTGAYLCGRAFAASGDVQVVMRAVAVAGILLLPALVLEIVHHNVFLELFPTAVDTVTGIGLESTRLGSIRIQGAFGQPIPLVIFLIFSAGCCLALWTTRDKRRTAGHFWLVAAVALLVVQYSTYARTGYLMIGGVVMLLLLVKAAELLQGRHLKLVLLLAVAVLAVTSAPVRSLFDSSGTQSSDTRLSAEYRQGLVRYALTHGRIPLLGSAQFSGPAHTETLDSAYLQYALTWGYAPGIGLLAVAICLGVAAVRLRNEPLELGLAAVTFGAFVALSVVALLQQQQVLIWLFAGATSGTLALHGPARSAPKSEKGALDAGPRERAPRQ